MMMPIFSMPIRRDDDFDYAAISPAAAISSLTFTPRLFARRHNIHATMRSVSTNHAS